MRLNPEFRRNLWLEFSPIRLIAMPLVLGLALTASFLVDRNLTHVSETAFWLFVLLTVIWGSYRAAASIGEEVNAHTWDAQRIASLGAWPMTWGKLFGATAFAWYGGLICILVRIGTSVWELNSHAVRAQDTVVTSGEIDLDSILLHSFVVITLALLAQALALGMALALHRKNRSGKSLPIFLCQTAALIFLVVLGNQIELVLLLNSSSGAEPVSWYQWQVPRLPFAAVAGAVFAVWSVIAVHRLMRLELQFRNSPLVLLAFMVVAVIFLEGHVTAQCTASGLCPGRLVQWLLPIIGVALLLVYGGLFLDRKDAIVWRASMEAGRRGDFRRLLTGLPTWLTPLVIGLAAVALLCLLAAGDGVERAALRFMAEQDVDADSAVWPLFVAGACFVLRDIAIVLFCNFRRGARRPDLTALIVLVVLYFVIGGLLSVGPGGDWRALAYPSLTEPPLLMIALPLVQAVIAWSAALWRARRLVHIESTI